MKTRKTVSVVNLVIGLAIVASQIIRFKLYGATPSWHISTVAAICVLIGMLLTDVSGPDDPPQDPHRW